MKLVEEIVAIQSDLIAWRRAIHAKPELGFKETATASFVAAKLDEFGIQVHRGYGNTGVVGVLREGNDLRSIGLRADMDALPIEEANSFEHRSQHANVMHACGHDGHTAMLLGAAKYLAESRNFSGQINLIFQPAEEGLGGAVAMINDGLFRDFPCDRLYAMHNAPGLPVGQFAAVPGVRTAAGAIFDLTIQGKGGHGAFPHLTIDPVPIAANLVTALQSIVSRTLSPDENVVFSITKLRAGDAYNVIPQTATLSGTARAFSTERIDEVKTRVEQISQGVATAFGAEVNVFFEVLFHPVINEAGATSVASAICQDLVGERNVLTTGKPSSGAEDFSFMSELVPSCYLAIGNGENSRSLHNPGYDFNDKAIVYGSSFFARVAERELPRQA